MPDKNKLKFIISLLIFMALFTACSKYTEKSNNKNISEPSYDFKKGKFANISYTYSITNGTVVVLLDNPALSNDDERLVANITGIINQIEKENDKLHGDYTTGRRNNKEMLILKGERFIYPTMFVMDDNDCLIDFAYTMETKY